MPVYKAIQTEVSTRRTTGVTREIEAASRSAALELLLTELGITGEAAAAARSATSGSAIVGRHVWTLVAPPPASRPAESPHLRRGGPTHRHV